MTATLDKRSMYLRTLIVRAMIKSRKGHFGSAMSIVEILRTLYDQVLRFNSLNPQWANRDRFILSKGHGCLALYAMLVDKSFIDVAALDDFCCFQGILGGHPERGVPGIETSTGSLGHGLSVGVGMAIASRIRQIPYRVFVLVGDGELSEGSIWEACLSAANNELGNLVVIVDRNRMQIYGTTEEVNEIEPVVDKFRAFNFDVSSVDGHDVMQLRDALHDTTESQRPRAVICNTIKGKGFSFAEHNIEWHYKFWLTDKEIEVLTREIAGYAE